MGDNNRSSVRSREFGTEVKRFRERVDLNAANLAKNLHVAASTVCRLERGDLHVMDNTNLSALLTVCGLRGNELKDYLAKGLMNDNGYYLAPNGDKVPDALLALTLHEQAATSIVSYDPIFVPGLLQTEDYIRALFQAGELTEEQTERGVRNRLNRQQILNRRRPAAPDTTFFVTEASLYGRVGGDRVMSEQIITLLMRAAESRITVRVLPDSQYAAGPIGGFRIMHFEKIPPVASAHVPGAVAFLEKESDVRALQEELDRLDRKALGAQESRDMLHTLNGVYAPGE